MFEIPRENDSGELHGVPDDEARSGQSPRYDRVETRVIHQIECFGKKRRDWVPVQDVQRHRQWRSRHVYVDVERYGFGSGRNGYGEWSGFGNTIFLWPHFEINI